MTISIKFMKFVFLLTALQIHQVLVTSSDIPVTQDYQNNVAAEEKQQFVRRRELLPDPKTVVLKEPMGRSTSTESSSVNLTTDKFERFDSESVLAVVNTPKCGTGGMSVHFQTTFSCTLKKSKSFDAVQFGSCENPKGIDLFHSHDHEASMAALLGYLRKRRADGHPKKCLILTAVRDPKTLIPSKFMEDRKSRYCTATQEEINTGRAVREYQRYLTQWRDLARLRHRVQWNIPHFMNMYNTNLTMQMEVMKKNGGYSLIPPVPFKDFTDSKLQGMTIGKVLEVPVQSACHLLLLHFEEADRWPDVFAKVAPGREYEKPEDRDDLCPNNADRYRAIKDYSLTDEERQNIVGNDSFTPYIEEWFKVYNYYKSPKPSLTNKIYEHHLIARDTKTFDSNAVIAIINTPKCGTGGMLVHFQTLFDCKIKESVVEGVKVGRCENPPGMDLVKSHQAGPSLAYLKRYLTARLDQANGTGKKCLITTAIRDPKAWLPSKFMEDKKRIYCDATEEQVSVQKAIEDYREWLKESAYLNRQRAQWVIPHLLDLYQTTLSDQLPLMQKNGGHVILPPVPPPADFHYEKEQLTETLPVQSHCTLILLQVEQSQSWPDVFEKVVPGRHYMPPEDRDHLCPNNANRNQAVKNYVLTEEERMNFVGSDEYSPYLYKWFRAYNFL